MISVSGGQPPKQQRRNGETPNDKEQKPNTHIGGQNNDERSTYKSGTV